MCKLASGKLLLYNTGSSAWCSVMTQRGGMGVCVEGIVVWKKPTQHCKEIILQLKKTVYCSFVIEG